MADQTWREQDHPRRPHGPGGGRFVHADLPALPEGYGQAQRVSREDLRAGDMLLHGGEWRRVNMAAPAIRGAYTDRGLVRGLPAAVTVARRGGWAQAAGRQMQTRNAPAEGVEAMDAAGYHYQGGAGPHDDALIRWLHEHSDINLDARFGGRGRAELDAALQPSTRPMVVYRGVDLDTVSDEWIDTGYPTTSADPRVALEYARMAPAGRRAVLRIVVPAGVGSAAIGAMPDMETWQVTDLEDSGEVLLQRGLRFRPVGRRREPGGIQIEVEAGLP